MEKNKYRKIGFNCINKILSDNIKSIIENSVYNYTLKVSKIYNYKECFTNELFRLTIKIKLCHCI